MISQYEKRFYEDFHKLVITQKEILKELQKMNKPLQEDRDVKELVIPIKQMKELINNRRVNK